MAKRRKSRRRSRALAGVCCPPTAMSGLGDPLPVEVEGPRPRPYLDAGGGSRTGLIVKGAIVLAAAAGGWWAYNRFIAK